MLDCRLIDAEELHSLLQQDGTLVLYSPRGESVAFQWQQGFGPVHMATFLDRLKPEVSFTKLIHSVLNQLYARTEPELVRHDEKSKRWLYSLNWENKKMYLWNHGNKGYAGPFQDFPAHAREKYLDTGLMDKVIKFSYDGDYRTVRIIEICSDQEGRWVIKGNDLARGLGYVYAYHLDRIKEKILLVN